MDSLNDNQMITIITCCLFYFQCGLPTVEECKELAESAYADGESFQAVKYYLLSPEPEKALPIGISYVKGVCQRDKENMC